MKRQLIYKLDDKQKQALNVVVIASFLFAFYFLRSFISLILVAAIASFIFYPLFSWLKKKTRNAGAASAITFLVMSVVIIIPFFLIILSTFIQFNGAIKNAGDIVNGTTAIDAKHLLNNLNHLLGSVTNDNFSVSYETATQALTKVAQAVTKGVLSLINSSIKSFASFMPRLIIFSYVFVAMLLHRDSIVKAMKKLNPIGEEITDLYMSKAGAMTKGMVRGQFIIAFCQGVVGAFTLWICGIHLFAFMTLILTILSIIPLGGGIVVIPIGIVQILLGNFWQGAVLLLSHFLIVTNIDNVLKPMLVPKDAQLNPALLMLAVFAGIGMFGFLGIVVGPVIMILIVTTAQVYLETKSTSAV